MSEVAAKASSVKRQGRSPAYPSIDLASALEKAQAQYDQEGKYPAPLTSAFKAWGYSPKSSGGREVRASLRYFGLVQFEGEGDAAKVKLTEEALRVITDKREDQSEKKALIRRLALNPAAHRKLFERYPEGIKSDPTAEHFLVWEEEYNESAAQALIAEFKATASFAGLYEPASSVDKNEGTADSGEDENPPPQVRVGDKIQWVSQGQDQFAGGATVLALTDDGQWIFTDQGSGAVPLNQVTVMEQQEPLKTPPPTPPHVLAALAAKAETGDKLVPGTLEEKFNTDEGVVVIRYPDNMTAASVVDLEDFFALFIKKAKRRAGVQ